MIPLKLRLKNFMCYRQAELSLEDVHLACLWGDNGSGKSALLDGLTWALWGKSRAHSDDDLVRAGETDTEAELEFSIGERRYRVIRKHSKPGTRRQGQTLLDVQVADPPASGGFKSISADHFREIQKQLVFLLRLDYETFTNSAFLVQGRSAEFSLKQPADRKEVLATILDLSVYDGLCDEAKRLARQKLEEGERLKRDITALQAQLSGREAEESEAGRLQGEIARQEGEIKSREALLADFRRRAESLRNKQEQLAELERGLSGLAGDLRGREKTIAQAEAAITKYRRVMSAREEIDGGHAQLVQVRLLNEQMNAKVPRLLAIQRELAQVEKTISEARNHLVVELRVLEKDNLALADRADRLPQLRQAKAELEAKLSTAEESEAQIEKKKESVRMLEADIRLLEKENSATGKEIGLLEEKLSLLGDAVRCPLCEADLGVSGREKIRAGYADEIAAKRSAYQNSLRRIDEMKKQHNVLAAEASREGPRLAKLKAQCQSQIELGQREIAEAEQAHGRLAGGKARFGELSAALEKEQYAVESRQRLSQLRQSEAELAYDAGRHDRLRQELAGLDKYDALKRELDEAGYRLEVEERGLAQTRNEATVLRAKIGEAEERKRALAVEVGMLPSLEKELAAAEIGYRQLAAQERQLRDGLARVRERLRHLTELESKKADMERLLPVVAREQGVYLELSEAFGKKGIPALLIERALPEIEAEANRLLGRMTDGRLSLKLETQRETRKGSSIETLDIKIADELGTRNYELYSGGEAFRIDLALRIALSRLLVRRAGTSLSLLIIDEGFGTQDSSGREKLVAAINSIQDDFEKIIVITHLEELRDAFPVCINVAKTAEGSSLSFA